MSRGKKMRVSDPYASTHQESLRPTGSQLAAGAEAKQARSKCSPLAVIARQWVKNARTSPFAAKRLKWLQEADDRMRAGAICSVCGGRALYFMEKRKYCRKHVHLGKSAYPKRVTPAKK